VAAIERAVEEEQITVAMKQTWPMRYRELLALCVLALSPMWLRAADVAVAAPTAAPAAFDINQAIARRQAVFAAQDKLHLSGRNVIVFVGSSIFEQWESLSAQMEPLPVLNRAIGGTTTAQQLALIKTLVLKYRPRMVVLYCGSNDINAGTSASEIAANVRRFIEIVNARLPATQLVYASILRAPQKRARWPVVDEVNARIQGYARVFHERVSYVDLNPAVADSEGQPRMDLYRDDQLHYLPPAYDEFTRLLKPVLTQLSKLPGA
jgi:lysophospholipase L1-like esterase